jgi:glycosyltransferase involved in cell wall biosynthesis
MTEPPEAQTVSIVLPTHNRAHLVGRAVRTVLSQTHSDWELIVVDDGSKDATQAAVSEFRDPRIRYLRNDAACGPARARNVGIKSANPSGYLAFLDDDDEWLPRKLERQLALFRESTVPLSAVGCGRIDCGPDSSEVHLPQYRGHVFEHLLARRARGYGAQLILVKRVAGQADVLFDEGLRCLEDADYSMRLALRGPLDFVSEALVKVNRNDGGPHVWNPEAAIQGYEGLARKYEKELVARPWVRSYYEVCMARDLASLGRVKECRAAREALAATDTRVRVLAWYAASLVGGSFGVRACARLLPIHPPQQAAPHVQVPV